MSNSRIASRARILSWLPRSSARRSVALARGALWFAIALRPLIFVGVVLTVGLLIARDRLPRFEDSAWQSRGAGEIPDIPVRTESRACCAFAVNYRVKLGPFPLPFLRLGGPLSFGPFSTEDSAPRSSESSGDAAPTNRSCLRIGGTADPKELGAHRYDSRYGPIDDRGVRGLSCGEGDAIFYTCRGGFVDSAELREAADYTAYLITQFAAKLDQPTARIRLADYGAQLYVDYQEVPRAFLVDPVERERVVLRLARWTAHQILVWREIAQWYGRSSHALFPEVASAFSPEDLSSSAIGVRMLDGVDWRNAWSTEQTYDD
jgi:hypothetical protein